MNCFEAQENLSAYMESELPAVEMGQVGQHIAQCAECAALMDAMKLTVDLCRNYPEPEMDPRLMDRILARTVWSPVPGTLFERLRRFVVQPLLTPRFAFGAGLTALFFALMVNLMLPSVSTALSSVSPAGIYDFMDQSVQRIYGQGLKAYDKKNEWEAQLSYYKNRMFSRLQYMIEKFDIPSEGTEDPVAPDRPEKSPLGEERSGLRRTPV